MVVVGGGGGGGAATFGGMPPMASNFHTLRQLLVQSVANILIELLNIGFIDNTDLVL